MPPSVGSEDKLSVDLPIDILRAEFETALTDTGRVVVTAETGAGKSTRIPAWVAEQVDGLVLVVEPRRLACRALAGFLADERGERVGQFFGSRVRFSDVSGPQTRVLFATPGVALRMLGNEDLQLGALVVDEFHERSWQADLVVAAAASLERLRNVPLVLMSATIDAESAAGALDAAVLHATGRTFPVDIRYDETVLEPSERDLADRAARATVQAMSQHDGDVLVFLPGMKDIRATETALGRREEEVVIVHGSQPPEALQRALRSSPRRRIYLATNVAETSITLPGVRVVIDSGLAKTRVHRAGRAALATVAIADDSMQQRAGRAGRVAAGICVRLWAERFRPQPHREPEIARTELDDMVLQAATLGLVGTSFDNAAWITAPPSFAVAKARERLTQLGAIDADGLTERGHGLAELPVSAAEAALLVGAPPEIDATLCDLVALLQSRGSLLRPLTNLTPAKIEDIKAARAELLAGVQDEVTMNLRLLRQGAEAHHVSSQRLREARAISKQLRGLLGARGEALQGLVPFILRRLPDAGFVLRPRAQKNTRSRSQPWANGKTEVNVIPFEPLDPNTQPAKPTAALILETEWLGSGAGVFGVGRMLLPAPKVQLADAGLGESTVSKVQLIKRRDGPWIVAQIETQLAGVSLSTGETELTGPDLHRAASQLVLENRIFKGVKDALADALHSWCLLADWPDAADLGGYPPPPPPVSSDPEEWLTQRFANLGLQTNEDFALLENEDLVPKLDRETGIPVWAYQPLVDAFPRMWTYQGAVYRCEVVPSSRKVVLSPHNAAARKAKEPPRTVLPRFHDFSVLFRQASRILKLR